MSADAREHFDTIADEYKHVHASWKSVYDGIRREIEPHIPNRVVLDIGNGGVFPYDVRSARRVIAVDISPAMLDRVQESTVEKVVADARDLAPIPDGSVDTIIYFLMLHHIAGCDVRSSEAMLERVFEAAFCKLRPGGVILIAEPFLPPVLHGLESIFFQPMRLFLENRKVPMIFFHSLRALRTRLASCFHLSDRDIRSVHLPIRGFVDPFGGSFPGRVRIPGWMCPTRYYLVSARKR